MAMGERDRAQHFEIVFAVSDGGGVVEIGADVAAQHAERRSLVGGRGDDLRLSAADLITRMPGICSRMARVRSSVTGS